MSPTLCYPTVKYKHTQDWDSSEEKKKLSRKHERLSLISGFFMCIYIVFNGKRDFHHVDTILSLFFFLFDIFNMLIFFTAFDSFLFVPKHIMLSHFSQVIASCSNWWRHMRRNELCWQKLLAFESLRWEFLAWWRESLVFRRNSNVSGVLSNVLPLFTLYPAAI
jgi:hypothetical protein